MCFVLSFFSRAAAPDQGAFCVRNTVLRILVWSEKPEGRSWRVSPGPRPAQVKASWAFGLAYRQLLSWSEAWEAGAPVSCFCLHCSYGSYGREVGGSELILKGGKEREQICEFFQGYWNFSPLRCPGLQITCHMTCSMYGCPVGSSFKIYCAISMGNYAVVQVGLLNTADQT